MSLKNVEDLEELVAITSTSVIPVQTDGVTQKVLASTLAATSVQGLNELGANAGSARARVQGSWWDVTDTGSAVLLRPHARMPKMSVKALVTTNVAGLSCATSTGGLSGSRLLRVNDVLWKGGQTSASENGPYRVYSVSGATANLVKLTAAESVALNNKLYLEVLEGTNGGKLLAFSGSCAHSSAATMPAVSSDFTRFDSVEIDSFVLTGDDVSPVTGDWSTILRRAQECALQRQADIIFSGTFDYRFTSRPVCWTLSALRGRHIPQTAAATQYSRILLDGCGGFFGPYPGDTYETVVYDSGIRAGVRLYNLNVVMVNGSDRTLHYGARVRGFMQMENCMFQQIYGNGLEVDTTGTGGNSNSDSCVNVVWSLCGKNGIYLVGGDANNILFLNCRSTNHGQANMTAPEYDPSGTDTFPGNDWGVRNESFLGCTFINCEFSSGHLGGIYDNGSFSSYFKCYTEGGTTSDIRTSNVHGGNITLRGVYRSISGATLTFTNSGSADTITRASGSFVTDGVQVGDLVTISGSASNNITTGPVATVAALTLTFDSTTSLVNEGPTAAATLLVTNTVARTSVANPSPTTRLPLDKVLSNNAYASSGHVYDDNTGRIAVGISGSIEDRGLTGATSASSWHTQVGAGGNSNSLATGYGSTSAAANYLETLPGSAMGAGQIAFRKGIFKGDPSVANVRDTSIARASLPTTGVPDTGAPGSANSGAYPVGSVAWEPTPGGAAIAYQVLTNSGSAAYNLTWGAIPNPSPTPVGLTGSNQTVGVSNGGLFTWSGAVAAGQAVTLSGTSALTGDELKWEVAPTGNNFTVDGIVITAGTKVVGYSRRTSGGAWVTKLWTVL